MDRSVTKRHRLGRAAMGQVCPLGMRLTQTRKVPFRTVEPMSSNRSTFLEQIEMEFKFPACAGPLRRARGVRAPFAPVSSERGSTALVDLWGRRGADQHSSGSGGALARVGVALGASGVR